MPRLRQILFRLQPFFRRRRIEAELSEEMHAHLCMATEANVAAGMSAEEARHAARREFGGVDQVKEAWRDERGLRWIEDILRDLRFALRSLLRARGFACTVLLTIAVCLGANVAIFALVNQVLLRPLPFPEADRLVTVYDSYPKGGIVHGGVSPLHYLDRKASITAFEETAAWVHWTATLGGSGSPESVDEIDVTPSFFHLLGARAALGRTLTDDDASEGKTHVVVLSDAV